MKAFKFLAFLFVAITLVSCSTSSSEDDDIETDPNITNDETVLLQRFHELDEEVTIDSAGANKSYSKAYKVAPISLRQTSQFDPPMVDGEQVQATMVYISWFSSRVTVSYNFRGATFKGGADVLQINKEGRKLRPKSNIIFNDADVNAVYTNWDYMFLGMATNNQDLVTDTHRSLLNSYFFFGTIIHRIAYQQSISSFAATSVIRENNRVYITSGNTGGLGVFSFDGSELEDFISIDDARWVDATNEYVVVLKGDTNGDQEGDLQVFDTATLTLQNEFPFPGAYTPEAKNTVEIHGHLAFIGAGKEGVQVMDLRNGEIVANLPIPDPASLGLSDDVVATNAVSVDDEYVFISNGEAGVYVGRLSEDVDRISPGEDFTLTEVGRLRFDDLESANHVTTKNRLVIVAAGLGGTKILRIEEVDEDGDDDDDDDD